MFENPLWRRRWAVFRKNRRGFVALWVFLALFFISLGAEFIANDKPILIYHNHRLYFPNLLNYSEKDLGGIFETEADYRDPYLKQLILQDNGWMLWPLIHYSYRTINYDLPVPAPSPPDHENWLGTDDQGRDVLSRLIYGFRLSVLFGLTLTVLSSIIGVIAGAIQGYFGGLTDLLLQRFVEIWGGLPVLYLLIILTSFVEPNFSWLLFIMLLFSWTSLVAVVRAEFLKGRNMEYVRAARVLGVKEIPLIFRHILPNCTVAVLTFVPFILNASITTLTSLDFLGLGLPPGSPSLGELLSQGKTNITAPWLGITGFVVLGGTLTLLIFVGEAVRDAFNPRNI